MTFRAKAAVIILGGLLSQPSSLMAKAFPVIPPAGYDQPGPYPSGQVQTVNYSSPVTGATRTMLVYTPPGYTTAKKYSVVYAYHGIGAHSDSIMWDWGVATKTLADNLIGQGKIKPLIIVAPESQDIEMDLGLIYREALQSLIPYIESNYSVYTDADHRGIYGYSWGGGITFNLGLGYLDTYHYVSPSSAAPSKADDAALFPNGGTEAKQKLKTLLISCGDSDWLGLFGASEGAHNYCVANDIPHGWLPVKGGNHDAGSTWRPVMWNFLQMADSAGISHAPGTRSAYSQTETEAYDAVSYGIKMEPCDEGGKDIGFIEDGSHALFKNVDFGDGAVSFQARVASGTSGGNIELRLDSVNGPLIGTCAVAGTGGWQTWTTKSCTVSGATGKHDLYLKFTGGGGFLFNFNWWKFDPANSPISTPPSVAPGGLTATASIERTDLSWTAASNATSYNIKRATTIGGPYTTIGNTPGTSYADATAIGGTTYYYAVAGVNLGGEATASAQVSATPTVDVPAPWLTRDVGEVGLPSEAGFSNGSFTLIGSGADIVGGDDEFRFSHVPASGDCTIVARVASLQDHINPWSKAGVMIRESLADNAANVFIGMTPGNGVTFQSRSNTGGNTSTNNIMGLGAPYWVKLVRTGNTFTGSYSPDGTNWTESGSATVNMASSVTVGLAVTSHNEYTLCKATFDHVTAPGWNPPPAVIPSGLTATAGVEKVTLNWDSSANATAYVVKRATTSGGPYTEIAQVTTPNYIDTSVVGRTSYYYVVSAVSNLAGETADSTEVSATPTVNVPPPWLAGDIGDVAFPGSVNHNDSVFTVEASGSDIWGSADAFRFVYATTTLTDFTLEARVTSVENTDSWAKAGVMIRSSLEPGAANAFVAVTPGNGLAWQYRSNDGGGSSNSTAGGLSAPYWVRLVRSGDTFTGYRSPDGATWTQTGSTTLTGITTAYLGLAVTSHNNTTLCTATFDNVTAPDWPPPTLLATATAVSAKWINLTWSALPGATSYNVKRSTTSGGPYSTIATGVTTTSFTDTTADLQGNAGYYYVISAITGGSETEDGPEAETSFQTLTGDIVGTPGSYLNLGDTINKVFDGNLDTFFDGPTSDGCWAGRDFGGGVGIVIRRIRYCPRAGFPERMLGGVFQGANQADFSDAVTLATISALPAVGEFSTAEVSNSSAFRHVRYLSPNGGWGNVAELEFDGFLASLPTPTGLSATAEDTQVLLNWDAAPGLAGYQVSRASTSGGPYSPIATTAATDLIDSTVVNGTTYYYVVTGLHAGVESAASSPVNARPTAPISDEETQAYISIDGGDADVMIQSSVVGHTYQLQYSDDLTAGSWQNHGPAQPGTGHDLILTMPKDAAEKRFYRVLIQP